MNANKHAVVAILASGVLGISSCDRNATSTTVTNPPLSTTSDTLTTTNSDQVAIAPSTSNTTQSAGMGSDANDAMDNTMATGTAVDSTSGGAGLAAENPGTMDSRETTTGAKKKHSTKAGKSAHKKEMKKKARSGAAIPPRGENEEVVVIDSDDVTLEEQWDDESLASSSATTAESEYVVAENSAASLAAARNLAFERQDAISKFYEPQSKAPDRTGSTSITGVDRSHAQMTARPGPFADPTIMAANDRIYQSQPIADVNIERYSYGQRSQFKNLMETRLELIHEKIGNLRATSSAAKPSNYREVLKDIQYKHDKAEDQLALRVESSDWNSYKTGFRDQVSELERSVDTLRTSMVR